MKGLLLWRGKFYEDPTAFRDQGSWLRLRAVLGMARAKAMSLSGLGSDEHMEMVFVGNFGAVRS